MSLVFSSIGVSRGAESDNAHHIGPFRRHTDDTQQSVDWVKQSHLEGEAKITQGVPLFANGYTAFINHLKGTKVLDPAEEGSPIAAEPRSRSYVSPAYMAPLEDARATSILFALYLGLVAIWTVNVNAYKAFRTVSRD